MDQDLCARVADIRRRLDAAALAKWGRAPEIIAVSKTVSAPRINEVKAAGIARLGENRVQETLEKLPYLDAAFQIDLIGRLQINKVKYIIDKVSMIHSVDSLHLAQEIDKRAAQHGITMDILIQVNSAQEESKFGISTDETEGMIRDILDKCPNIRIRGLMCIAPFAENPEDVRVYFAQVKKLYDEYSSIEHKNLDFKYLSMGMSHDYEVAILEGSNLIRVGTAIFGERDYSKKL